MDILTLIEKIQEKHDNLIYLIQEISCQIAELEREGVEYGRPTYKGGKYLRLIRGNGENREFVYIGSDAEKIAKVESDIERAKQVESLKGALNSQNRKLSSLIHDLDRIANGLKW